VKSRIRAEVRRRAGSDPVDPPPARPELTPPPRSFHLVPHPGPSYTQPRSEGPFPTEVCDVIRVKARMNESLEQLLKRFKKACEKEGLTREMKRSAFYEKPSDVRRRKERQLIRKVQKEAGGFGGRR